MEFKTATTSYPNETVKPLKPMDGLASRLHGFASDLNGYNERLYTLLNRLTGPQPPAGCGERAADKQPDPSGALMVAQFGAERISQQLSELSEKISRLESIV